VRGGEERLAVLIQKKPLGQASGGLCRAVDIAARLCYSRKRWIGLAPGVEEKDERHDSRYDVAELASDLETLKAMKQA
jgi:hypothetical protein